MRIVALTMCFLAAAAVAAEAQEPPLARADLPRGVAARLTAIIDAPETRRLQGDAAISEPEPGNVVVFTGPATVSAKIGGDLIVIDGIVRFEPGARVGGDVTIVGGDAFGLENATIDGTVTMYGEGFSPFRHEDRVLSVDSKRRVHRDDDHRDWGHSSFTLRTEWNYNRVEGLPLQFGPIIETGGRNPTRIEAMGIWRTEVSGPFETDHWGYAFRAEQFMGGKRDFRIGASLRSVVAPIESWQLTRNEASLATLILHDDSRDYYLTEGWSAYARLAPSRSGLSLTVSFSDENFFAQPARDPWTLFDNTDDWRRQPLVAEGSLQSLSGNLELDHRNDAAFPSSGFYLRGQVSHALGGSIALPHLPSARPIPANFTRGIVDARVYQRAGREGTLSFRGVMGGALSDHALPPQFQHALGGAGSLPGYALFSGDCGARRATVTTPNNQHFFTSYGCDRMAMASAEYRGGLDFHIGGVDSNEDDEDGHEWNWDVDASPNWIVFFDAARGWAHEQSKLHGARDTGALFDAGLGLVLGDFGIYGAVPLTGSERPMRFFVRLGARF